MQTATPWAVCERALSHNLGGAGSRGVYARADLLDQRRGTVMQHVGRLHPLTRPDSSGQQLTPAMAINTGVVAWKGVESNHAIEWYHGPSVKSKVNGGPFRNCETPNCGKLNVDIKISPRRLIH